MVWLVPPDSSLKLNFVGASKRNSSKARARGVLWEWIGKICRLYFINMGHTSNNATEFEVLEHGLEMMIHEGMMKMIVEGDSALAIRTTR